ncbi:MAG TPA: homoserine kinase [Gammaproteobacteria bacterium]|nr:homoserine kinase [Gammaproteobacteria bacterium]
MSLDTAKAVAPASVGNVAVGFDVLGHALAGPCDQVTVRRSPRAGVRITRISGVAGELPRDPERNAAGRGVLELARAARIEFGLDIEIEKGIPVGSGMGGSGASAVASVVAANALLGEPYSRHDLLAFALAGEAAATGAEVLDNVAPSLFGGLVLALAGEPVLVERVPVPNALRCVLVTPALAVATREARALLAPQCALSSAVMQAAHLGGLIAGCYAGNLALIARALDDVLIEPQRAGLVDGFAEVMAAGRAAGALGGSLSGSGPSVFAWVGREDADAVAAAMVGAFVLRGIAAQSRVSRIDAPGARCVLCSAA